MGLKDYFKSRKIYIWKETFVVVKSKRSALSYFLIVVSRSHLFSEISFLHISIDSSITFCFNISSMTILLEILI